MNEIRNLLSIDGKIINFSKGQTILEAAKAADIYIPTLCYVDGLPPFGGCRLCIIKVESIKGYPPACTTPAQDGMKIITKDEELQELRREVLKLILSEHPYSCLICEGKENCEKLRKGISKFGRMFGCFSCANKEGCELKSIAEYLDITDVPYQLEYKNYELIRDDPFFEKDYNLCILCGRCVRICNELRGIGAINFINRGHETQISTEFELSHINTDCQFCGACVDICPTGALSSKNTKWSTDFTSLKTSICGFCSVGCGFDYYCIQGNLIESRPNKHNLINRGQACVIGRFCIPQFNNGRSRLKYPSFNQNGEFIPSKWEEIYEKIVENLKKYKPEEIAVIASSSLSNESSYILNKFAREVLKTNNISTLPTGNSVEIFYKLLKIHLNVDFLPRSFQDIERSNIIFLINANIQATHPVLMINLKKAKLNGAKIISINLHDIKLPLATKSILDYEIQLTREGIIEFLLSISKNYVKEFKIEKEGIKNFDQIGEWLKSIKFKNINEIHQNIVDKLLDEIKGLKNLRGSIILDLSSRFSEDYLINLIGTLLNIIILSKNKFNIIPLWKDGNCEGVFQNISYNNSKNTNKIINAINERKIKALYLTERMEDLTLFKNVEFLILQDIYPSNNCRFAHIVLPTCTFLEESGTFINSELKIQNLVQSSSKKGISKPDWEIFCDIARTYNQSFQTSFSYSSTEEILEDIRANNHFFKDKASKNIQINQTLFKPNLEITYLYPLEEPFTLKSFKFRGEPVYNQVEDLKELIEYRALETGEILEELEVKESVESQFKIISNEEVAPNVFKLSIEAPLIAKKAKPGHFIIMMMDEQSERLPLTLADWNELQGTITIFFQETGFSTRELTYLKPNDFIYSIVGPLGKEFPIEKYGTVLLGGGCYGIAAIYPIAKALKAIGNHIIMVLEAKSKKLFYLEKEIEDVADEVVYCTSDGSKGIKGKIGTCLRHLMDQGKCIDKCHFVGCNLMMMEASNFTKTNGPISTSVSLSTIMIDGTGMCGGCRLTLIDGDEKLTKFACVDGPIFDAHMVNWNELINRGRQFDYQETQIFQTHSCKATELLRQEESNEQQ